MDSTPSIRDRIFSTADALYQESGRQLLPTVDAVRKAAKVNMNDANVHMREWRRTQSNPVPPVIEPVPTILQQSGATALAALWSEATRLASETLRAAEGAWLGERTEAEAIQEQLATAYDALARKLEASQTEAATSDRRLTEHRAALQTLEQQLIQAQQETAGAVSAAGLATARAAEIERRATDLRQELDIAHRDLDNAARDARQERTTHGNAVHALRQELDALRQGHDQTQSSLRQELSQAREEAAALRGRLAAATAIHDGALPRREKPKPDRAQRPE